MICRENRHANPHVSNNTNTYCWVHRTLGSAGLAADCARTTRWANLIQHIRTVDSASSQIRRILCFIATIRSHVNVSYELLMLPIQLASDARNAARACR